MSPLTLDDVIKPYLHLPSVVQTALLRVETHPTFRTLTKSTIKVLKAIISRASATNGTAVIRARFDRLAAEADVSGKTVQRAMRGLQELGWIFPASEGRSEWGVFESKRYTLAPALCELVHLPTKEKPASVLARETEMSDGAIYVDLSLKEDQREISIKNREGQPPTLPEAVSNIPAETGILPTGVCKLLGLARKAGHQLDHVYVVAKPYLAKIGPKSAARAYRYLLAMLHTAKPVDYAAKAAQLTRQVVPPAANPIAEVALRVRYKRYIHVANGMRVRFFDGSAEVSRDGQSVIYVGDQMLGLYRGVANGNLREVEE